MKKLSIILLLGIAVMVSCSKKEGCTDVNATNYDANATTNNGSCVYPSASSKSLIVGDWKLKELSASLSGSGATIKLGIIFKDKLTFNNDSTYVADQRYEQEIYFNNFLVSKDTVETIESGTYIYDSIAKTLINIPSNSTNRDTFSVASLTADKLVLRDTLRTLSVEIIYKK